LTHTLTRPLPLDDQDSRPSICGYVSDIVVGLLTSPICAVIEVFLVNVELWSSQIPRYNAFMFTLVSIALFPLWYAVFLALILRDVCVRTECTRISNRDNRIIYESHAQSMHNGGRLTGGVLIVNTIRMHLEGGVGLFGRKVTRVARPFV